MDSLRAVKGMNDILPEEMHRFRRAEETFRTVSSRYGYEEVRTPVVEPTALFVRGIGDTTDIVEKEMYTFVDKGDKSLTLRPEGTASAARAYIQHTVHARKPVAKWIYLGPMYRRERPAKGRYRQFYQLGAEIYGDPGPYADAELIEMLVRYLRELGVLDLEVLVNSLGSGGTRARYRDALLAYLTPHRDRLSPDSQRRLDRNPFRILDSKAHEDKEISAGAPSILDHLDDEDRAHFAGVQETLTKLDVPYTVEPTLVRGLDYYTRTLFEVKGRGADLGAQDAICGGGRYDTLVESLGGPATTAIGFAIGLERLLMCMSAEMEAPGLDAFVVVVSAELRSEAAVIMTELRAAGLAVDADLRGNSLKSQMRRANKANAKTAIIIGEDEIARGCAKVRNLSSHDELEVERGELAEHLTAMKGAA